jgi:hypothetical protein
VRTNVGHLVECTSFPFLIAQFIYQLLACEFDDFLGYRSWRLLGHIVPAPFEDTSANFSRDETRCIDQRGADARVGAESKYQRGESPLGAFATLIEPVSAEIPPVIRQCGPRSAWRGIHPHIFVEVRRCDGPWSDGLAAG